MQSQCPILIFAQSGRFIAESATRAGYSVRVADCFCDRDTLAVASSSQILPPLSELSEDQLLLTLTSLSQGEDCLLICGTGVENFYPVLARLPANIKLTGNSPETIEQLRTPQRFFPLLEQLSLPYPPVRMSPPTAGDWLLKNMHAAGGSHIHKNPQRKTAAGDYFQQWVPGQSYSVCFVANGEKAQVLAWNQQITQADNFILASIIQPAQLSQAVQDQIDIALKLLVEATGLKGLNSLDFIVDNKGHCYLLEVNPRITSSAELVTDPALFQVHLDACEGKLPASTPRPSSRTIRQLSYLFANTDLNVRAQADWPVECHDIPTGGIIKKGMPVCTIIVEAASAEKCQSSCQRIETEVLKNCVNTA